MPQSPFLSKTLFQRGRECAKRMWLDHHDPSLKPRPSLAERARTEEGIAVGKLAQRLYPGGVTAKYVGATDETAALKTRDLIEGGATTIFEATFVAGDRVVRCDVLTRHPDGGWIVDEVKASTFEEGKKKVKPEHVYDVAYQVATLRACGIEVRSAGLVVLDKSYGWDGGEHDLRRLFVRVDLTAECEALQEEIEAEAQRLVTHLVSSTEPDVEINTHCKKCDYGRHCLDGLPHDDLIYMPQVRPSIVVKWRVAGYGRIPELPRELITDRRMLPAHRVLTTRKPWIDGGLGDALAQIRFPAAFVDFESCQPAVPAYAGTAPYTQVCFQWSCHLMSGSQLGSTPTLPSPKGEAMFWNAGTSAEQGEVRGAASSPLNEMGEGYGDLHREFLHMDASDPRPEFCRRLWEAVRDAETIVVYSSFERTQVKAMAEAGIPYAAELLEALETRMVDLEKIVKENVYLEEFKYRTSIKTVLPALVPSMSYKDLNIADGTAAMTEFRRMIAPNTPTEVAAKIRADLLAYCKQDTLAMVEVYQALIKLACSGA